MKKIYLSLALTGFAFSGLYAQQVANELNTLGEAKQRIVTGQKPVNNLATSKALIWTEDFANGLNSTNGLWTQEGADQIWKHSFYPTSGEWSNGTDPMASTTAANGYMLFDADSVNFPVSPNYINLTGELISPVIDLSTNPSVMLSFEQDSRFCCAASHDLTISVSSDGGTSWGTPHVVNTGQAANADFYSTNGNSYVTLVNINAEAGGQSNVKIKFTWDGNLTGSSHYYWTVDDVCILDLPENDMQMWSSWISGENNEGNEYGRTPEDQQDANYMVGSQIYNFGGLDQTNLLWGADFGAPNVATATEPSLVSGDTVIIETTEAWGPLAVGVYSGDYGVISDDEDAADPTFADNINLREFEITDPASVPESSIYSLDGVGVYTNSNVTSLGTDSFTGGEDGLVCATMYHIKQTTDVSGIRVMLATGSVAGGEVYGSIKDTATVFADNMTDLFTTNSAVLTATDISNGYVDLLFAAPVSINAGAYFAAAELYSAGNTNDVRVLDDETVEQPFWSSVIYIPGDQTYTNGTALGIRMLMGNWITGIDENTLSGVSIYPNPSEGVVNISNDNGLANTITVHDLSGKLILTTESSTATTIDLSNNTTGVYLVEVTNASGSLVERVVIK